MSELKTIAENLQQEYKIATKPQGDFRNFIKLVINHYSIWTNSNWAWVLYDYLVEREIIDGNIYLSKETKNKQIEEAFATGKLKVEELKQRLGIL
jgi:hypothetical protein